MREWPRVLWVVRVVGVVVLAAAVDGSWAYGPKSPGDGNNLVLALPAGAAVVAIHLWTVWRVAPSAERTTLRLWTELNVVVVGAVIAAVAIVALTFDGS